MSADTESFNKELYDLLKVRGYDPVSKMWNAAGSKFNPGAAIQKADVFEFRFIKDGKDYGKVWASIVQGNVIIYYDDEQSDSPAGKTPGIEYDDSWLGFLTHVKNWAQGKQLSFELASKSRLGDDLKQREYYKTKEKLGEGSLTDAENCKRKYNYFMRQRDLYMRSADASTRSDLRNSMYVKAGDMEEKAMGYAEQYEELTGNQLNEGYYPMGKKASYNDAVPNVKIVIQHSRALEEGEQRYRNVAKIFLENVDGERFLAPTTRPGIARVYARHIAEGGVPNDERWGHIKSICEEYNKMAGFVRATRGKQFNESAQALINEGASHYKNLRETLSRMTGHRGYNAYFESWTPTLMEDEGDDLSINELFVQETVDPRIESAMPILSRLKKPVTEMSEVDTLAEWADSIISEKLEMDSTTKSMAVPADEMLDEAPGAETLAHNQSTEKSNLKAFGLAEEDDDKVVTAKMLAAKQAVKMARKTIDKAFKGDVEENFIGMAPQAVAEEEVAESGLQAYLGKKKYGEKGMKALQQAGRDGASKEKMASIRAKHDKLDEVQVEEDLDANQKRVGQLGPTEKVKNNNIGKLVGANESTEIDPELARIIEIAKFKR